MSIIYNSPNELTLEEFIKIHSKINNQFIGDFFSIFNENNIDSYNLFIINADKLYAWLGQKNKSKFIKRIKKKYSENIDYIIKINKGVNTPFDDSQYLFLTIDASKNISQSSRTQKGDEVRKYFIEIEKILKLYYLHIINSLKIKQTELLENKKPSVNPKKGFIYIFEVPCDGNKKYKLGKTINLEKRKNSHNCGLSTDLILKFQFETENITEVESCAKMLLKNKRFRNDREIYETTLDEMKIFIRNCDSFIKSNIGNAFNMVSECKDTNKTSFVVSFQTPDSVDNLVTKNVIEAVCNNSKNNKTGGYIAKRYVIKPFLV